MRRYGQDGRYHAPLGNKSKRAANGVLGICLCSPVIGVALIHTCNTYCRYWFLAVSASVCLCLCLCVSLSLYSDHKGAVN